MENRPFELDIIYYIKSLNRLLTKDFDKRLSEFNLTSQQGRILFYIFRNNLNNKDVHQVDIEKQFHLSKSTVSGLVKRMEKNGLINKIQSHPYHSLVLTDKSRGILDNIHKNRIKIVEKISQGFSEEQQKQITNTLEIMVKNMEKEEIENVEKD